MPDTLTSDLLNSGLSIIVPVYNEAEALPTFLNNIERIIQTISYPVEVLLIDDGSTDNSLQVIQQSSFTVFRHFTNRGYGAAVKTGIEHAKYEALVIIDADSTYHLEDIITIASQLSEWDMVVGARTGSNVNIPLLRRPVKWVIRKFASWMVGHSIPDLNSGLRAFRRSEVMKIIRLLPDGFSLTTTITVAMHTVGKRVHYEPVNYAVRSGQSKFHPFKDTWNLILLILRTVVLIRPLNVFVPLSFILMICAFGVGLYTKFILNEFMDATFIVLMMTSIQMFVLGLIADLIVRINLWTQ